MNEGINVETGTRFRIANDGVTARGSARAAAGLVV
jgi:hypothetical protein